MSKHTVSIGPDEVVEIEQVGGDLQVQGWDASELQASGDGIRIERRTGTVAISGAGDVALSVPRNARVSSGAVGGDARLSDLSGNVELGVVGGDAILVNLTGPVQLAGMVGGDTRLENVANVSMSAAHHGPSLDFGDRIRRKVEKATRRAEEKMRRAETRAQHRAHVTFGWDPLRGAAASQPSAEPVSDEERMTILRMLQEKKITSEQAEQLLSALEGNA